MTATTANTAPTAAVRVPDLQSKLPGVGTTVFAVMSQLATEVGAVNLGQGFPDFGCDPRLVNEVSGAMTAGLNQYPPMPGVPALREAVAAKIEALYGRRYDVDREITVTAGATQAIMTAVLAIVRPGDEVVVLDPCYDCYVPAIELAGGTAVRVALGVGFRPDFAAVAAAIGPRTRALILNTPHNPSATVWTQAEMQQLDALLAPTDVIVISDEVYEHMVFDGAAHHSAASFDGLAARSFVVSSFGKTYHVTGWKVGTVAAPAALMAEFRKVHQFNVFTVNTPVQWGLACYMADPAPYLQLPAFYQAKRDRFRDGLAASRLHLRPCEGTYFQCVDYRAVSDLGETDFCRWLATEHGVAAIPLSPFYGDGREQGLVRFCFAKKASTLDAALEKLAEL